MASLSDKENEIINITKVLRSSKVVKTSEAIMAERRVDVFKGTQLYHDF